MHSRHTVLYYSTHLFFSFNVLYWYVYLFYDVALVTGYCDSSQL